MKYIISYSRRADMKMVQTARDGATAHDAIESLCNQYGWRCSLKEYDADTRGREWAVCSADTDGGTVWNLAIHAVIKGGRK